MPWEAGMALNIKDPETERLAFQVRRREKGAELRRFLEEEVWPTLPRSVRGRRLSRKEEDAILGYGRKGV